MESGHEQRSEIHSPAIPLCTLPFGMEVSPALGFYFELPLGNEPFLDGE